MKKVSILIMIVMLFCFAGAAFAASSLEGIVKAVHEVELAFQLDGVIAKTLVKEGMRVGKGEVLVQLDDSLQKLEVSRREAILNDRAEIDSNKKNLSITKELLASARDLYNKMSAVSHDEVMNLEMQYHSIAGKIEVAEARKTQEQIEYLISKEMLARYSLISPINGVITQIKREAGEWAKTGEILVSVADTSTCYAEFNIEEKLTRNLRADKRISIKVREGDALVQKMGKIIYVSPVADKASALVRVKVEFENKNGKTVPGILAYLEIR